MKRWKLEFEFHPAWILVLVVIFLIWLNACETIPPDEGEFNYQSTPGSLKNHCEIQCFPKAVRWNHKTGKCVCLKRDAE